MQMFHSFDAHEPLEQIQRERSAQSSCLIEFHSLTGNPRRVEKTIFCFIVELMGGRGEQWLGSLISSVAVLRSRTEELSPLERRNLNKSRLTTTTDEEERIRSKRYSFDYRSFHLATAEQYAGQPTVHPGSGRAREREERTAHGCHSEGTHDLARPVERHQRLALETKCHFRLSLLSP